MWKMMTLPVKAPPRDFTGTVALTEEFFAVGVKEDSHLTAIEEEDFLPPVLDPGNGTSFNAVADPYHRRLFEEIPPDDNNAYDDYNSFDDYIEADIVNGVRVPKVDDPYEPAGA
jgi:hypothetical protein